MKPTPFYRGVSHAERQSKGMARIARYACVLAGALAAGKTFEAAKEAAKAASVREGERNE